MRNTRGKQLGRKSRDFGSRFQRPRVDLGPMMRPSIAPIKERVEEEARSSDDGQGAKSDEGIGSQA